MQSNHTEPELAQGATVRNFRTVQYCCPLIDKLRCHRVKTIPINKEKTSMQSGKTVHILDQTFEALETVFKQLEQTTREIAQQIDAVRKVHVRIDGKLTDIENEIDSADNLLKDPNLTEKNNKQLKKIAGYIDEHAKALHTEKKAQLRHPIPSTTTLEGINDQIEQLFELQKINITLAQKVPNQTPTRFSCIEAYDIFLDGNQARFSVLSAYTKQDIPRGIKNLRTKEQQLIDRETQSKTRVSEFRQTLQAILGSDQPTTDIVSYATSKSILLPAPSDESRISRGSKSVHFEEYSAHNTTPKK